MNSFIFATLLSKDLLVLEIFTEIKFCKLKPRSKHLQVIRWPVLF